MKKIIIFFLFLTFLACATSMESTNRQVGSNQPTPYKAGYCAGCDSGYVAAGNPYYRFKKDVNRYKEDDLYKQGWNDGFSVCKGKYDSINEGLHD